MVDFKHDFSPCVCMRGYDTFNREAAVLTQFTDSKQ